MNAGSITETSLDHPDAKEILHAYLVELTERYLGREVTDEDMAYTYEVTPNETLLPPRGGFFVAREGEHLMGCIGYRMMSDSVCEVKRMFVAPAGRGRGWGGRLLAAAEEAARARGATVMRMDTRSDLVEARGLYAKHGYTEVEPYNDDPYSNHWFAKPLP